ncbi:MAG: flagellar biosynthesis protein FlhA [Erythrobacter sp. 34-65-8]|nr:MAG: flagellar biosynthesis protein FlhA [Erythrobacter sp. 34-65-8]
MAIDADIAAGLLTPDKARARRSEVSVEADFYGSMDGASKFVKGDAIAGLLILAVNVFGGFALGMIAHGMGASEAGQVYVSLAVGDALVTQVPALLLSIAAAAIVTRVTDSRDLVGQIGGQVAEPRGWLPVAAVLGAIGLIPAMPQTLFLPAAAICLLIWHRLRRRAETPAEPAFAVDENRPDVFGIADVTDHTLVALELGYALVHLVDEARKAPLLPRLTGIRKQLSRQFGFVLPQFRVADALELGPRAYRVRLGGVTLGQGEVRPDRLLAIDTGEVPAGAAMAGEATLDPSFGCPALWIDPATREIAVAEGYLVVDPGTVIATHLNQLLLARIEALLGPEEVRALLDTLREKVPGLVEAITPEPLSLAALTRFLRALVADGISLSHAGPVFTSLALALQKTHDFNTLIDHVRTDLGGWIVGQVCPPDQPLQVATLDAGLEAAILGGMIDPATGQPLIDPDCGRMIAERMAAIVAQADGPVALIVQPPARRALAALLRNRVPRALVLSLQELPVTQPVNVLDVIGAPAINPEPEMLAA